MATDIVLASELGAEFDLGVIQAGKIRLKLGTGLAIQPDGTIVSSIQDISTTSIVPRTWAGTSVSGAVASAEATTANALELSDGSFVATGRLNWNAHGLTIGAYYYTSQTTAGAVTDLQPTTGWVQRLFFVADANTLLVNVQEAYSV